MMFATSQIVGCRHSGFKALADHSLKRKDFLMPAVAEERVLVVPTKRFHALGHFQGFTADMSRYLPALLEGDDLSYRPRGEMEQDPSFKQLIPYMLFRYTDSDGV